MKTDATVELYYSGAWNDITSDVYTRDGVRITRGRPDESQRVPPSTLELTLDNRDGTYSPRNPLSPLYGIIGRNTPIRVSVDGFDVSADTFNRTSASGWGTCEYDGTAWTFTGSGGSVSASTDAIITVPLTALHSVPVTGGFRLSYLTSVDLVDVTVTARVRALDTAGGHDILGGDIEGGLMLRVQDANNYYHARVEFNANQTIGASLHRIGGVGQLVAVANVGITYSGQWLIVKAQCVGSTIRMKIWEQGDPEPASWDLSVVNASITAAGGVGIRSGVEAGNTNTGRKVYYQNFTLDHAYRFTGEVESWPQRWSVEGGDVWAPITANGIMRRLNAPGTTAPAVSPIRRAVLIGALSTGMLAWWPLEAGDQRETVTSPSGLDNGTVLVAEPASAGTHRLSGVVGGSAVGPPGSPVAIDLSGGGQLAGDVPLSSTTNPWRFEMGVVFKEPVGEFDSGQLFRISYGVNGLIGVFAGASPGVETTIQFNGPAFHSASSTFVIDDGAWHHIRLDVSSAGGGANTAYVLAVDGVVTLSGTATGLPFGRPTRLVISPTGDVDAASQAMLWTGTMPASGVGYAAFSAHTGETATERVERLCDEEGFALIVLGDPAESEPVGVQRVAGFVDLLQDAADAEGGVLYEPRGFLGFAYRTQHSLYNQGSAVELDYAAGGEVAPPLEPVEDTDATVNDVTVTRFQGGSARAVKETGTLNVQEPSADPDGVGRYRKDITLVLATDDQCVQQAAWLRHLGTWDEARFPVVNVDLTAMEGEDKDELVGQAASLNVGDRFAITSPPSWLPPDSIEQHAQGFVEAIGLHRWAIGVNATPAGPYNVLQLETDTTSNLSRIPAAYGATTLNEALDTTETGVDIISATVRWIDSAAYAAQFPFDVIVGGERMRVTACTGTGLTQTVTVTRSINGVIKSHASGAPVQLFRPPVIAR